MEKEFTIVYIVGRVRTLYAYRAIKVARAHGLPISVRISYSHGNVMRKKYARSV